jgi:hypothetical protein
MVLSNWTTTDDLSDIVPTTNGWVSHVGERDGSMNVYRTIKERGAYWFDNGVIKVRNTMAVSEFDTDYASLISFNSSSKSEKLLYINLFYNPYWQLTVNEKPIEVQHHEGFMSALIPAGVNKVKFEYRNTLLMISRYLQIFFIYGVLVSHIYIIIRRKWLIKER